MKRLMHNMELLIVLSGKRNWRAAAEAISEAKVLLGELERYVESARQAEAKAQDKGRLRSVRVS